MSVEHGPLESDEQKRGFSWWLSGRMMIAIFSTLNRIGFPIRFDPEKNRISVRGESENPGSEMKAGVLAALTPIMSVLFYSGLFILLGPAVETADEFSAAAGVVVFVPFALLAVLLIGSFSGHFERVKQMRVVDHTTEPLPDDLDDLKQQFVDGDLDDQEFEQQLEDRLTEVEC